MSTDQDTTANVLVAARANIQSDGSIEESDEDTNPKYGLSGDYCRALEFYIDYILEAGDQRGTHFGHIPTPSSHLELAQNWTDDGDADIKESMFGEGAREIFKRLASELKKSSGSPKTVFVACVELKDRDGKGVVVLQMSTNADNPILVEETVGGSSEEIAERYSALDKALIYPAVVTGGEVYKEEDNVRFYQEGSGSFAKYFLDFLDSETRPSSSEQLSDGIATVSEIKQNVEGEGITREDLDELEEIVERETEGDGEKVVDGDVFLKFVNEIANLGHSLEDEEERSELKKRVDKVLEEEEHELSSDEIYANLYDDSEQPNVPGKFKYELKVEGGEITVKGNQKLDDYIQETSIEVSSSGEKKDVLLIDYNSLEKVVRTK